MVTSAVAPTPVNRRLDLNRDWLRERLGLGVSCDVIWREIEFAGRRAGLLAVRGLF
ncbi:MAG: hypothetical protein IRZ18_06295, partial [Clostridia bacterium]|nr:hypothetical protein [Clostridia bacterium]